MPTKLTSAELDVMNVLWERGKLTAKEVHRFVIGPHKWSYPATRTVLSRLVKKGRVKSNGLQRYNFFEAAIAREEGIAPMIEQFASRVLEIPVPDLLKAIKDCMTPAAYSELRKQLEGAS